MEKFAVDLDKVLDDFEYHEEQALRHQYNREDLPAKKYQRPPFQRINLADADFSPSRQTSSPIISYASPAVKTPIRPLSSSSSSSEGDCSVDSATDDDVPHPIPDLLGKTELVGQNLPDLTETAAKMYNECNEEVKENINEVNNVENPNDENEPKLIEIESDSDTTDEEKRKKTYNKLTYDLDMMKERLVKIGTNEQGETSEPESRLPKIENDIENVEATQIISKVDESSQNVYNEFASDLEMMTEILKNLKAIDGVEDKEPEPEPELVKFVNDPDIDDSDLHKLLEELQIEESKAEAEANEEKVEIEQPQRPTTLNLRETEEAVNTEPMVQEPGDVIAPDSPTGSESLSPTLEERRLGKISPFWVPDTDALNCMQCALKFTVLKRRHHCRACGRVLCNKCAGMRACLEYLNYQEQRVCELCFRTLTKVMVYEEADSEAEASPRRRPNPNNPMEYCSTVPPPLQATPSGSQPPPSVLVPVLKREGSSKNKETPKKVMFSDGIRPGGELTALDEPPAPRVQRSSHNPKRVGTPPGSVVPSPVRILPPIDPSTQSFIVDQALPPICQINHGQISYQSQWPMEKIMLQLSDVNQPVLLFAVNRHLIVSLKLVKLDCCMGKTCWVFSTRGMPAVGQDEILIILQTTGADAEPIPAEVFQQLHFIYQSAEKENSIGELGYWSFKQPTFLDSRQHGGFLFVRPTFQCVQNIDRPAAPFLVAILIHRLELPWARQLPLRLMLRLGAEFRYYPCSLVSVRDREPVYYEIGQTIMKLLVDFRSYTFTLPSVRGLRIHMEEQQTSVLIPRNRYDQLIRALNNSNDPVLALAGTFSPDADAHLVCMESKDDEFNYTTQAINIQDKPRKVTGASFVVFSASLKAVAGTMGKSRIIEDGLMVEVGSDTMAVLRNRLRALEDWSVRCGPNQEELIQVVWSDDEKDFNKGVRSVIDGTPLDGVPSIRVHNGMDYMSGTKFIRWTEVFIIKCEDGVTSAKIGDPMEVNRLSESIAKATCEALTKAKLLDLLTAAGTAMLALRTTVAPDSVCYEAGSNGEKLPPIYMKSLDNGLIPVLHKATGNSSDACAILELVFHILDQ